MLSRAATYPSTHSLVTGPEDFLSWVPALERHARRVFRFRPPGDRDEAAAAAVAHAWAAAARLTARGKDPAPYFMSISRFAVLAVVNGRRIEGGATSRDVLEPAAARRRRFTLRSLSGTASEGGWWRDLVADPQAPVAAQAAFNIDFPCWLEGLPAKKRRVARLLARGHGTAEVAGRVGVSPGRVAQMRRELSDSWQAFHGDPAVHLADHYSQETGGGR